jgi:hypothetical protein
MSSIMATAKCGRKMKEKGLFLQTQRLPLQIVVASGQTEHWHTGRESDGCLKHGALAPMLKACQ